MNNEPVAWLPKGMTLAKPKDLTDCIPLYTHPAKTEDEPNWKEMYWEMHELNHKHWSELKAHPAKTLTDEEIEEFAYAFQLWQLHNPNKALEGIMDFARAILRKAQEK